MCRTSVALLVALAAIAGVAVAADDSNIGSRHAVDLKKVRRTSIKWGQNLLLSHCDGKTGNMHVLFWVDDFTDSKRSVR